MLHRSFKPFSAILLSALLATPAFGAVDSYVNAKGKTQGNIKGSKPTAPKPGASGKPVGKSGGGKTGGTVHRGK